MKRSLALAFAVAAVLVPVTQASASHVCVTSGGDPVVCEPAIDMEGEPLCATYQGRPLVCV